MNLKKAYIFVILILLIDQISKIYVKTHFTLSESVTVTNWFQIHFVENKGMAWGIELPGNYGKLFLTVFRIFAVAGIIWWLNDAFKKQSSLVLKSAVILILAGAVGNIIDSVFYGVIFNASTYTDIATAFHPKPYGSFFFGEVVDMFYFPIWRGVLPQWIPKYGGNEFTFFNAIFNVADVAISTGFGLLVFFNKKCFDKY